jgi:hypothetical protein
VTKILSMSRAQLRDSRNRRLPVLGLLPLLLPALRLVPRRGHSRRRHRHRKIRENCCRPAGRPRDRSPRCRAANARASSWYSAGVPATASYSSIEISPTVSLYAARGVYHLRVGRLNYYCEEEGCYFGSGDGFSYLLRDRAPCDSALVLPLRKRGGWAQPGSDA